MRLTKKINENRRKYKVITNADLNLSNMYTVDDVCIKVDNAIDKLGQLEDIEEECNIDIIKSIELCKKVNTQKKVYTKERWGIGVRIIIKDLDVELFHHRLYSNSQVFYINLDINEYGKTWALTKEELEK